MNGKSYRKGLKLSKKQWDRLPEGEDHYYLVSNTCPHCKESMIIEVFESKREPQICFECGKLFKGKWDIIPHIIEDKHSGLKRLELWVHK